MCASQAVHVLVEVHHLKSIELVRNLLDLLLLARLDDLHTLSIPFDVLSRRWFVLATSLDSAAGDLSIVDVSDLVVADRTGNNLGVAHDEVCVYRYDLNWYVLSFKARKAVSTLCRPSYIHA